MHEKDAGVGVVGAAAWLGLLAAFRRVAPAFRLRAQGLVTAPAS